MDARCRIELLGQLRVKQGEREITLFRTQKTGALLGYLAYQLQEACPRELLTQPLWLRATQRPACFDCGSWRLVQTSKCARVPREAEDGSSGTGPRRK